MKVLVDGQVTALGESEIGDQHALRQPNEHLDDIVVRGPLGHLGRAFVHLLLTPRFNGHLMGVHGVYTG